MYDQALMRNYNLLFETKAALVTTNVSFTKLAEKVGVSTRWLYKLHTGEVVNPSVNEVQKLHDWFLAHPKARL